jgi:hypothetical protein
MVSVYTDADSGKGITSFDFTNVPGATAIIGGAPGPDGKIPIIVTVPSGTPITSLTPELTHTGISITGDGVSGGPGTVTGSSVDFTNPVSYTVTAQNGDTQTYGVSVLVVPPATPSSQNNGIARIDGFYFASPQAVGVIDQNAKTINVTVPYGTSLGNLVPTIYFTGAKIAGNGGIGETTVNPAYIGANFSSDVSYRVTAVTATITADYTVRVSVAKNAAREITAFSFDGIATGGTSALIASTPGADGKYPVEVVVPLGTSLTNLKPVVTHTGVSISGGGISGSSASTVTGSAADFTNPVSYTVTAQNGQTREYLVTLRAEDNNLKQITGFYFTEPLAAGIINEAAKTIDVTVPSGTSLGALRPTVYYTGASLSPVSGRVNSFSSTAVYTVTARNGTAQPYTVRVNAKPSGAKDITAITFPGAAVIDTIIGAAPGPDGKVPISVVVSGSTDPGTLRADITHTGKSLSPGSGTVMNFQNPVSYRVTAEDGSVKDYLVSVHRSTANAKLITGFAFNALQTAGEIDQTAHTIEVYVPASTNMTSLVPTLTYIGASITPPGGAAQSANPFTDSARDFTGSEASRTYRVTAADADGTTQDYTVSVRKAEQNTGVSVTFQGITDPSLMSASFDQTAGVVTLILTPVSPYGPPYEWYLDGHKLNVSGTEPRLEIHTAGMAAGQHEVVVVVTGGLLPNGNLSHYTNKVYFTVQE